MSKGCEYSFPTSTFLLSSDFLTLQLPEYPPVHSQNVELDPLWEAISFVWLTMDQVRTLWQKEAVLFVAKITVDSRETIPD